MQHIACVAVIIQHKIVRCKIPYNLVCIDIFLNIITLGECFQRSDNTLFAFIVGVGLGVIKDVGIAVGVIIRVFQIRSRCIGTESASALRHIGRRCTIRH